MSAKVARLTIGFMLLLGGCTSPPSPPKAPAPTRSAFVSRLKKLEQNLSANGYEQQAATDDWRRKREGWMITWGVTNDEEDLPQVWLQAQFEDASELTSWGAVLVGEADDLGPWNQEIRASLGKWLAQVEDEDQRTPKRASANETIIAGFRFRVVIQRSEGESQLARATLLCELQDNKTPR